MLCVTAQRSVFHNGANAWHDCVFSELQIGHISGSVIGTLVFVGAIVSVFIIVKRYRRYRRYRDWLERMMKPYVIHFLLL